MAKIRLVVAEGCTLLRQGLVALLNAEADFAVVGEASDAEEAHRVCLHALPDLILLAASLPGADRAERLDVITRLRACCPAAAVVVLGADDLALAADAAHQAALQVERNRALFLGAAAYLHVGLDHTELARALRAVAAARLCADHENNVAPTQEEDRLRAGSDACGTNPGSGGFDLPKSHLTERESAIVVLIAQGLCNKEIAHRLGISTQTVKNHVSHLLEKLALADRTQLAVYALEQGFGRRE